MALLRIGGSPTFAQIVMLQPNIIQSSVVSTQTFTVNGLDPDGMVFVNAPKLEAGLALLRESVTGPNTLSLQIWNITANPIVPALQPFTVYQP